MKTKSVNGKVVNRSEKIREYLKSAKPSESGPKAVSDALKAKGIKVSPNLVSLVKMKMAGNKKARKKSIKAKARIKTLAPKPKTEALQDHLLMAKNFASLAGGVDKAKEVLDVLAKLMS